MPEKINFKTLSELQQQITICRTRMQKLWEEKGCTDPDVLAASIELDELLNQYHLRRSSEP